MENEKKENDNSESEDTNNKDIQVIENDWVIHNGKFINGNKWYENFLEEYHVRFKDEFDKKVKSRKTAMID